jgi:signal transduction histidine kinase
MRHRVLRIKSGLAEDNLIHVAIEDTGSGITASDLENIFKPLFTTKARGMGMGLSICRSVIESHKGRIWVSPGVDGGSTFHFELPANGRGA